MTKKKVAKHCKATLEKALEDLSNKTGSLRTIEELYGIPRATLSRHASGKSKRIGSGRSTVLPTDIEELIVACLEILSEWGFGLASCELQRIVSAYIKSSGQDHLFKNGYPGKL